MGTDKNEAAQRILGDFKVFLWYIWKHLGLPEPTPVQYEIADYLQYGTGTGDRKMVEAFRGVGKSWITSAYVLWCLLKDPDEKFEIVSASKDRADAFSAFTKRLIKEVNILKHLQPDPKKGHRNSMLSFDVGTCRAAHAPSVKSVGIFGQLTGSRASKLIADDVEVPNNSATEDMREKLSKACTEFEAIIIPGGDIIYLGTPQTEESVYNQLPDRGYSVHIWPARVPEPAKVKFYRDLLAPSVKKMIEEGRYGECVDPLRFDEADLMKREMSYGKSGFALQFMLDTSLSDAEKYPLKTADLIVMDLNAYKAPISVQYASSTETQIKEFPNIGFTGDRWYKPMYYDKENWREYEGSLMYVDPSGRGADELAYCVVKYLYGYLWLTRIGGIQGGYSEDNLKFLALVAKEQAVNLILVESNFGDGMFNQLLQPIVNKHYKGCAIEEDPAGNTQKEVRIIDVLEPVFNQHKLVVDAQVVRDDIKENINAEDRRKFSVFYQATHLTKERGSLKHDDRVDCLAGAVRYWVNSMGRDADLAVEEYHEEALQKELQKFMDNVVNKPPKSLNEPRWGLNN